MSERISILYVDDEENNLNSFRAYFRKQYDVYTALSASDAFLLLEKNKIQVIISDQRMPTTTGIEFLEKTTRKYPDSMRLLITAYADIDIVIEAINRGQISKFIQKPWDWEKLSLAIENCVIVYKSRVELKEKNEQLQKTNNELNKFVYSISHDLRAPLMSILGIVHLSKKEEKTETVDNYFDLIKTCVVKLDTFIKNIIDYYKNSQADEIKENIDFKALVANVCDSLKNLDETVLIESQIEQRSNFIGDFFRLEIILKNLLSNAIKYQNPNNINHTANIKISVTEKEACIIVFDNGIGILPEHIQSIFNLFFRAGNTKQQEGSGLGLYIVKESIEKIGGTINVESTPLVGTSFKILIPNHI